MTTENKKTILDTQLIQTSPDNTGILSKTPRGKHGANPLTTIFNTTFDNTLKTIAKKHKDHNQRINDLKELQQDTEHQEENANKIQRLQKRINKDKPSFTMEYVKDKQPGIIQVYRDTFPDTWEEEIKILFTRPEGDNVPFIDFMNKGQNDTTRGLPVSLQDLKEYQERGGYKGLVFSPQARPNILVFDFDYKLTPEELETIIKAFKQYLWLIEYKEANGHAHIYINSTTPDRLHYSTRDENNQDIYYDQKNNMVKVDIFKDARGVVAGANPTNEYNIYYDNKPGETIPVRDALQLMADTMKFNLNVEFMDFKINKDTHGHATPLNNNNKYEGERLTNPRSIEKQNEILENMKEDTIKLFTIVAGLSIRHSLYLDFTGALLHNGFDPENVRGFMDSVYYETGDTDPRPAEYGSTIQKFKNGEPVNGIPKLIQLLDKQTPNIKDLGHKLIKQFEAPRELPEKIKLRNGYIMNTKEHNIIKISKKFVTTHMTASICGVTIYTEKHLNPEIQSNQILYSLKYETETGETGETTPDTIDGNATQLKEKTFTVVENNIRDIIKLTIEYYKRKHIEEHKQITPPEGFYLNIETGNIAYKGLTKEIRETIETPLTVETLREILTDYESLTKYYKSIDKFISNTLSGCQLPLTYLVKQVKQEYNIQTPLIRAVSMTGTPGTGKSYNGEFIIKFSGVPDEETNNKNYGDMNTPYQYGDQCTRSTLPLLINEADGLAHPRTKQDEDLSSLVKASITSMSVRSRSIDGGKTNIHYVNYRNIVFNSNETFRPDYGNLRRLISQVYTLTEIITGEDMEIKNFECPDNVERVILNRFFGAFIQTLINKITMYNKTGNNTEGITNVVTNNDFTKNIILDMYETAGLDTELYNKIYNYNTDIYKPDITPTDANTIIKNNIYNYIISTISEHIKATTPDNNDDPQTTINEYTTQSLYDMETLTNILYEEITRGHIPGVSVAVKTQPPTIDQLQIALTRALVDILNENKEIQITLADLEEPTGGKHTQIKNIGSKGVRVSLGVFVDNVFN